MKSSLFPFTLLALISAVPPGLRAAEPAVPPGPVEVTPELIDRLMAEAHGQNPALEAAGSRAQAANSAVAAIRTWDDPTASFGVWAPGPGGFSSSAQGNLVYGLDEKLPLHGLPDLKRKVAAADASRDQLAAGYETQKLRRDLLEALYGLALAGREADLAGQDLAWLDAMVAEVDHRYRVGQASQVDWLKVQTARAIAGDDLTTKQEESEHSAFALNRILNRDLHAPWPRVAVPSLAPSIYYTPQLIAAAMAAEPRLQIMRQESLSAQAAADLTHRERLPDVSVGLQAWQYSGDGGLRQEMATVNFSLPWLNRGSYDNEWRSDEERKRASDFAAEDQALSVREELHHHLIELDAARRRAVLYQDQLIPLTQQTLASAQAAWEHNLGPFQDILDAHRMLVADQLALAQALTGQNTLLAEVSYLTGTRDQGSLVALAGKPTSDHEGHSPEASP